MKKQIIALSDRKRIELDKTINHFYSVTYEDGTTEEINRSKYYRLCKQLDNYRMEQAKLRYGY